jgi:Tol biopolymer transport system component
MRSRTAVYVIAGLVILGVAGLYVIVTNQPQPQEPMIPPTSPPVPPNAQPWTQAVDTEYACLHFIPVRVDTRTGVSQPSDVPEELIELALSGRSVSPDGRHEIIQQGRQVLVRFDQAEPLLVTEDSQHRAWELAHWSPNNRYVALETGDNLFILDAERQQVMDTIPLNARTSALMYIEWSADSLYLAYAQVHWLLRVWSSVDGRVTDVPLPEEGRYNNQYQWSPQGHRLAYLWVVQAGIQNYLSVYTPGEDRQPRFSLPVSWVDHTHWSPDGKWIAVQQQNSPDDYQTTAIRLLSLADSKIYDTMTMRRQFDVGGWIQTDSVLWSPDSRSLLWYDQYWEQTQTPDYDYQVMRYDLAARTIEAVETAMPRPPVYASDGTQMALTTLSAEGLGIELVSVQDNARIPFISEADDAGDAIWSPDGQYVAAVWAKGRDGGRQVYLSWMGADGTAKHTLDDAFWDVRDLHWLNDGRSLAYIAKRREGYSLELADLESGEIRVLLDGLDEVREMSYEDGGLWLAWRKGAQAALSGYNDSGDSIYTLAWEGPLPTSKRLAVFFSPDQQYAAIKTGDFYHEMLYIARTDGSWGRTVRADLYGLGDPLWSPDSKILAFTQATNWGEMSLEVVTTDGSDLWRADSYPEAYGGLVWQRCA